MLNAKVIWMYGDDVSQVKSQNWLENYPLVQKVSDASSYLLVAGMMFCAGVISSELARHFYRDYLPAYLPWLCLIAAVQGMYVYHLLRNRAKAAGIWDVWLIYFSEWVVLLLFIKGALYLERGIDQLSLDWIAMKTNPFSVIFADGQFIVFAFVMLICWGLSKSFAEDIHELRVRTHDLAWEVRQQVEVSRMESKQNIQSRVFSIGLVLMFLALASRIDLPPFVNTNINATASNSLLGLLLYFSLGFILLSQTQFALLRGRWLIEKLPIPKQIGRNWMLYGLIFFVCLGILAISLPTGYSIGLLDTLRYLVYLITSVLFILYNLVLFFFAWLFRPILQSMSGTEENEMVKPLPTLGAPSVPEITSIDPSNPALPWTAVMQSILLWGLLIGLVFYAVIYSLRQRTELWVFISKVPVWGQLKRLWHYLKQLLRESGRTVNGLYQSGARRIGRVKISTRLDSRRLRFHPRRLAPREQVRYYFLALLRKSESYGFPRMINQTPYQYEEYLNERVDELEPDLHKLTDAFLEANYSQHVISSDQAASARSIWQRINRKIRREE